jgi:hypothetical protein
VRVESAIEPHPACEFGTDRFEPMRCWRSRFAKPLLHRGGYRFISVYANQR